MRVEYYFLSLSCLVDPALVFRKKCLELARSSADVVKGLLVEEKINSLDRATLCLREILALAKIRQTSQMVCLKPGKCDSSFHSELCF